VRFTYAASKEHVPDFKSRAVMKVIDWDYSHSLIMVDDSIIFHATGPHEYRDGRKAEGFHMIDGDNFDEFMELHELGHKIDLPVKNPDFAYGYCHGSVGKDYSESQLAGLLFPVLKVFTGDEATELICSEFPIRFIMQRQIVGFKFDKEPDWVCPKTCTQIMYELVGKSMP